MNCAKVDLDVSEEYLKSQAAQADKETIETSKGVAQIAGHKLGTSTYTNTNNTPSLSSSDKPAAGPVFVPTSSSFSDGFTPEPDPQDKNIISCRIKTPSGIAKLFLFDNLNLII